jgi:hypothetical protein
MSEKVNWLSSVRLNAGHRLFIKRLSGNPIWTLLLVVSAV